MAEPPAKLESIVSLIESLDRGDRIQMLIDMADQFKRVPARIAAPPFPREHRTPACESEVFVFAEPREDGALDYHFAVENPQGISAKATAALLDQTLSGAPLEQVLAVNTDVVYRLFGGELSMGKSMGLMGIVQMIQSFAKRAAAATA